MIIPADVADPLRLVDIGACAVAVSYFVKLLWQHFVYGRVGPYKSTMWVLCSLFVFVAGGTYANLSRMGNPFRTLWIFFHIAGTLIAIVAVIKRNDELEKYHKEHATKVALEEHQLNELKDQINRLTEEYEAAVERIQKDDFLTGGKSD